MLHVGYMDTEMVCEVAAEKSDPADIAGIAAAILADNASRQIATHADRHTPHLPVRSVTFDEHVVDGADVTGLQSDPRREHVAAQLVARAADQQGSKQRRGVDVLRLHPAAECER